MLLDPEIFDRDETLLRFDGDEALMRQIIGCFLLDAPRQVAQLGHILAAEDWAQARRVVHAFRGAAANVGAGAVLIAAFSIEEAAGAGQAAEARRGYAGLVNEVDRYRRLVVNAGLAPGKHAAGKGDGT